MEREIKDDMNNIAIIPARSGSKGLKDKNIKELNGKPLLAYSVEAALQSNLFDTIHVSTDSEKYAEIARSYGADEPFLRSDELASDNADPWDAIKETILKYERLGKRFDIVTLLQPTSPLRTSDNIIDAYMLFKDKNANGVLSVCESEHPVEWYNILGNDLNMEAFAENENKVSRRQEAQIKYRINGAIYMLKIPYLFEDSKHILRSNVYGYIMDKRSSVDIDTQYDFDIAEAMININKKLS